jgi:hypothetical protein
MKAEEPNYTNYISYHAPATTPGRAKLVAFFIMFASSITAAHEKDKFETRCGWFANPSPNNATLTDRDGEWDVSVQGEYEAQGEWPEFPKSQWIYSGNADYGSGCACMNVRTDSDTHRVIEIKSSAAKPLSLCRRDKAIKKK